jgi:enhancing lycopene biosynthesis protein 2
MKQFAIILSGSGVYDGSEIHEATMVMLSIIQQECTYDCFAPDIFQHEVVNHLTGKKMNESRNVLVESARIARGEIKALSKFNPDEYDAVIFPGGSGVIKNLSDYAFKGDDCEINTQIKKIIIAMHQQNKPIGALCISPIIIAKALASGTLTVGNDEIAAKSITNMGATHVNTTYGEVISDKKNKIFTTPCYMLDSNIADIYEGASNLIKSIIDNG